MEDLGDWGLWGYRRGYRREEEAPQEARHLCLCLLAVLKHLMMR